MAQESKILIIGGTGYFGKFLIEASLKEGHPTFVLVRESTLSDPVKGKLVETFKTSGAKLVYGDLHDHGSLVKAIKEVDVVISTVGVEQLVDQTKIVDAIKEAGNVKKFYPSEFGFGFDVDSHHAVEPAKSVINGKGEVRRAIEAAGIPHTYLISNAFLAYFLPTLIQPGDKVVILGDGNAKAVYNVEHDIGTFTVKSVDDPRTLNKFVHIGPPKNAVSFNEIVSIWEKKNGKTLEKEYVSEEQLLKRIQEAPVPENLILSISHAILVKGDINDFEIEPSSVLEASELYPEVKYTTVEEYIQKFA